MFNNTCGSVDGIMKVYNYDDLSGYISKLSAIGKWFLQK
jgi:hypothetical protein